MRAATRASRLQAAGVAIWRLQERMEPGTSRGGGSRPHMIWVNRCCSRLPRTIVPTGAGPPAVMGLRGERAAGPRRGCRRPQDASRGSRFDGNADQKRRSWRCAHRLRYLGWKGIDETNQLSRFKKTAAKTAITGTRGQELCKVLHWYSIGETRTGGLRVKCTILAVGASWPYASTGLPVKDKQTHQQQRSVQQPAYPFLRECMRCQICKGVQLGPWAGWSPRPRRLQGPLGALPCEGVGTRTGGTDCGRRGPLDGGFFAPVGPRLGKGVRVRPTGPGGGGRFLCTLGNLRSHIYWRMFRDYVVKSGCFEENTDEFIPSRAVLVEAFVREVGGLGERMFFSALAPQPPLLVETDYSSYS